MGPVLIEMLEIYQPNGIDWMGYKARRNNPYTFHHIMEARNGGQVEINNGAILTRKAHDYLNYLDVHCHQAYDAYQMLFRHINNLRQPVSIELYEDIMYLAYEIEVCKSFNIDPKKDYFEKLLKSKKHH